MSVPPTTCKTELEYLLQKVTSARYESLLSYLSQRQWLVQSNRVLLGAAYFAVIILITWKDSMKSIQHCIPMYRTQEHTYIHWEHAPQWVVAFTFCRYSRDLLMAIPRQMSRPSPRQMPSPSPSLRDRILQAPTQRNHLRLTRGDRYLVDDTSAPPQHTPLSVLFRSEVLLWCLEWKSCHQPDRTISVWCHHIWHAALYHLAPVLKWSPNPSLWVAGLHVHATKPASMVHHDRRIQ